MIPTMRCLLAVDAGGTKCETLLVRDDGTVLAQTRRERTHAKGERHAGGLGRAEATVSGAIASALDGRDGISELHVSGHSIPEAIMRTIHAPVTYHPVGEAVAAMALVGASAGVVALAGTGAFAFGRTTAGEELLLDGIGPLYGDHGGAFQIGLAAVRAVGKADWHPRYATSLDDVVPQACRNLSESAHSFHMVSYMLQARDRSEIASLARLVDAEAEKGDRIARDLLKTAAEDLAETISCVVDRLGIAGAKLPMVGTGSVAVRSRTYWTCLCDAVLGFAPNLKPVKDDRPPAYGHVLAMADGLGIDTPSFRAKLFAGEAGN